MWHIPDILGAGDTKVNETQSVRETSTQIRVAYIAGGLWNTSIHTRAAGVQFNSEVFSLEGRKNQRTTKGMGDQVENRILNSICRNRMYF